jgi:hypothetical protein
MLQARRSRVRIPMKWIFFFQFTLSFQPHYGLGLDWDSNRNEYQESSWEVKGCLRVRLTTLPSSMCRLSRKCESLDVSHPYGPPRPVTGIVFYYTPSSETFRIYLPQCVKAGASCKNYWVLRGQVLKSIWTFQACFIEPCPRVELLSVRGPLPPMVPAVFRQRNLERCLVARNNPAMH